MVLSPDEVAALFAQLVGEHALLAWLLYGTGLRITEALQLRMKDPDFASRAEGSLGHGWQGPHRDAAAVLECLASCITRARP